MRVCSSPLPSGNETKTKSKMKNKSLNTMSMTEVIARVVKFHKEELVKLGYNETSPNVLINETKNIQVTIHENADVPTTEIQYIGWTQEEEGELGSSPLTNLTLPQTLECLENKEWVEDFVTTKQDGTW